MIRTPPSFTARIPADARAIACLILAAWLPLVLGFVPDMLRHVRSLDPPYPLVIHLHALAFVGWMVLLSVQSLLVRRAQVATHRRLGAAGLGLALAMVVLGCWAGLASERQHAGTPQGDPPFLAIMWVEMLAFSAQVAAAAWLRRDGAAHKRMMLLATLFLTTAGFGRFLAEPLGNLFGDGPVAYYFAFFGGTVLLVFSLGAYDLATRRQLHPAYVAGAALGIACQVFSTWLYFDPAWKSFTARLVSP